MKFFLLSVFVCVGLVHCLPEAPAAPYAPSGWRPNGPAFELPSRNSEPEDTFRAGKEEQTVEVTEEEVQYTGDVTTDSTTPFLEYGPPSSADGIDDEATTPISDVEDGLTVQGLPSSEPAKEFRVLPSEPLKDGRNQKLRVQQRQKTGRLQQAPQFQRQQIASFSGFQAPNKFGLGVAQTGQRNGKTFGQSVAQFGQLTLPRRPVAVIQPAPVFFQRQEVAANPIAVPAQAYGPANEYGPPAQNPQEPENIDLPEQVPAEPEFPQVEDEVTTVQNDFAEVEGDGNVVAIANSFSEGERYTQRRQGKSAKLKASQPAAKLRIANLRPFNEPVYTFNQFGQLVRVF